MIQITPEERVLLEGARAVIDRLLGAGTEPEQTPLPEEPKWMRLIDYALSRSISRRSLDNYIAQGLPTRGEGKSRRVVVADADAWLERRRA